MHALYWIYGRKRTFRGVVLNSVTLLATADFYIWSSQQTDNIMDFTSEIFPF